MEAKKTGLFHRMPKKVTWLQRHKGLSIPAYFIFLYILDRYQQSVQKANDTGEYTDKQGRAFCLYSYEELSEVAQIKCRNTISGALKELEELGFIERRRRFNASTAFYVTSAEEIDRIIDGIQNRGNENSTNDSNEKLTSEGKHTSNENITYSSNEKLTNTSNENSTNDSNEIIYSNKNNKIRTLSKNNISNNNKAVVLKEEDPLPGNKVATAIRQEIRLLIGSRKIKVERVLLLCNDIQRLKRVFSFADKHKKLDGWIIACLRDGWEPQEPKKEAVECYNAADEWLKKYSGEETTEEEIYTTSEGVEVI